MVYVATKKTETYSRLKSTRSNLGMLDLGAGGQVGRKENVPCLTRLTWRAMPAVRREISGLPVTGFGVKPEETVHSNSNSLAPKKKMDLPFIKSIY